MKLKESPGDFVVTEIPIDFSDSGEYTILRITKRELNTEDVAQILAKSFGVSRKALGYAGAKDRYAVTTQYFSVKRLTKEKAQAFKHEKIAIEYVGIHSKPLSLGDLQGNRFEIVVRELEKPLTEVSHVRNYYGEQRFGQNNVVVGRMIVKKDFAGACDELGIHTNIPVEALKEIPRHTLLLYVHAYQSWLWNTVLEHLDEPPEKLPLVGFGTDLDECPKEVRNQYEQLLRLEETNPRDFIIKQLPGISPEGDERVTMVTVKDLELGEFCRGVQKVSFSLQKGSYATIVVKALAQ